MRVHGVTRHGSFKASIAIILHLFMNYRGYGGARGYARGKDGW